MKIGIDIRPLQARHYGGISEYINNLLPELFKAGAKHQFILFISSFREPFFNYSELLKHNNVELKSYKIPNKILFFSSRFFNFPKVDKLLGGIDVLFCPHFFPVSVSKKCKKITTFHDISFDIFPEFFNLKQRLWHKLVSPKRQAKNSDIIISVSHSTKQDLIKYYKLSADKIRIVYSGVNKKLLDQKIQTSISLPKKYILTLSLMGPRKNTLGLIRAFDVLKKNKEFTELYLLVAGGFDKFYKSKIKREIKKSPHQNKIVLLGPVKEEQKSVLYKNAQLFVYPSLYEGFGFPPLEAMYCGVPTVVSHNTSLPEVTGGATLLVDPYRPRLIAEAMEEILQDARLYNDLLIRGRKQAEEFDWRKTAQETLNILEIF